MISQMILTSVFSDGTEFSVSTDVANSEEELYALVRQKLKLR